MTDFTTQTPAEIDTALAQFYGEQSELIQIAQRPANMRRSNEKRAAALVDDRFRFRQFDAKQIAAADAAAVGAQTKADIIAEEEIAPRTAEYVRRGCWTRAYLVRNNGGHVHTSTGCDTCFASTDFGWMTQDSGKDTDEIVEEWGESACTVCHPTAPTNPRFAEPSRQSQQAIADRQAEKDAKADAKAAKKIVQAQRERIAYAVDTLISINFSSVDTQDREPQWIARETNQNILGAKAAEALLDEGDVTIEDLMKKARAKWNREGYNKPPTIWFADRMGPRPDGDPFPGMTFDNVEG